MLIPLVIKKKSPPSLMHPNSADRGQETRNLVMVALTVCAHQHCCSFAAATASSQARHRNTAAKV